MPANNDGFDDVNNVEKVAWHLEGPTSVRIKIRATRLTLDCGRSFAVAWDVKNATPGITYPQAVEPPTPVRGAKPVQASSKKMEDERTATEQTATQIGHATMVDADRTDAESPHAEATGATETAAEEANTSETAAGTIIAANGTGAVETGCPKVDPEASHKTMSIEKTDAKIVDVERRHPERTGAEDTGAETKGAGTTGETGKRARARLFLRKLVQKVHLTRSAQSQ